MLAYVTSKGKVIIKITSIHIKKERLKMSISPISVEKDILGEGAICWVRFLTKT